MSRPECLRIGWGSSSSILAHMPSASVLMTSIAILLQMSQCISVLATQLLDTTLESSQFRVSELQDAVMSAHSLPCFFSPSLNASSTIAMLAGRALCPCRNKIVGVKLMASRQVRLAGHSPLPSQ